MRYDCIRMTSNQIHPGAEGVKWRLWYRDTFDRETPVSLEASGTNLVEGLYDLWFHTLTEGITEDGSKSFSVFWLTWGDETRNNAGIDVATTGNQALVKLRRWAGLGSEKSSLIPNENPVLMNVALQHYRLLGERSWIEKEEKDSSAESRQLLIQINSMRNPEQLEDK